MTPLELRAARKALGLTQQQLALALGLSSGRIIRAYEAGDGLKRTKGEIPGPVASAIQMMLTKKGE